MKLILIIVLSCTFAAVCFGMNEDEFNRKAAGIKRLIRSRKSIDAFFVLKDLWQEIVWTDLDSYKERLNDLFTRIQTAKSSVVRENEKLEDMNIEDGIQKFNYQVGSIEMLMSHNKLDEAFFELADAYKFVGNYSDYYLETLDDLTSETAERAETFSFAEEWSKEMVIEKLKFESKLLDEHINKILDKWIEDSGQKGSLKVDQIVEQLKRKLESAHDSEHTVPDRISNIVQQSQLCSVFGFRGYTHSSQLQDEAAIFTRIAFLLQQMSFRNVHPGSLTVQGQMLAKLEAYCNLLRQQSHSSYF